MTLKRVLATFGNGDCGRLGHSSGIDHVCEELPRIVKALLVPQLKVAAAGGAHTAAVDEQGSVYSWGLNDRGQLGHSSRQEEVGMPTEVSIPEKIVALAAGHFHTLCVGESGSIWSFGCNSSGQLGLGSDLEQSPEPRLVDALHDAKVVAVAAGMQHSLALTAGGEVYSWGNAANGRLGHGTAPQRLFGSSIEYKPRLIRALEALRVSQISAGQMHSAAVSSAGDAYLWGDGRFHQLGSGTAEDVAVPTPLPSLKGSTAAIACGSLHTLALQHGGGVLAWGANQNGVLGLGHEAEQRPGMPTRIPRLLAAQVSAGWKHSAAVTSSGQLHTWGWGGSQGTALSYEGGSGTGGQLGQGNDFDYWAPHHVQWLQLTDTHLVRQRQDDGGSSWTVDQVSCGLNHTAAIIQIDSGLLLGL